MTVRSSGFGVAFGALALVSSTSLAAPAFRPLEQAPVASSVSERVAPILAERWSPDPAVEAQREALHRHLKDLGIPADAVAAILVRIDGAAQQRFVPADDIERVTSLASDAEGSDKARELLHAFAELVIYGEPRTADLAAQDAPRLGASSWNKDLGFGEVEVPGLPPTDELEPRIGGVCQACPSFDFGPFTPSAVYQFHSSSTSTGFNDCAWYAFNVTAGQRYEFTTCAPGAALWDTVIEVYNPADCVNFLRRNDDCQITPTIIRQSTVLWDASYSGVAHVKLRGFNSSHAGAYTLAYRSMGIVCETCANPNPVPLAAPTALPQCTSGTTSSICPSHFYTVQLTAGETYQFTTCPAIASGASAGYDTFLRLWSPSCGVLAANDDSCSTVGQTTRSTINFTATVTGPHRLEVTGRTLSNGTVVTGSYSLCWRRTSAACATCAAGPYLGTFTPLLACQSHSSNVTGCQDSWYQFVLTGGLEYEFTTCSIAGGCTAGGASFDTVLDLRNSACTLVATDDDGCGGNASKIGFLVPPAAGGVYRHLVKGKSGATGTYTLTYREVDPCVPPTSASVGPTSGTTGAINCARTQTFTLGVDAAATLPVTYSWTVTPPPGGVAAPPSGLVTSAAPGGAASFTTTLSGEGAYTVSVTASNGCGSTSRSITYTLVDDTRPTVTAPASDTVECDAVPAPESPTVRDNCDPAPALEMTETITPGTCPGNYTIRRQWIATDRSGNASSPAVQVIVVRDTTPPTISADTTIKYCAYPPNHDVACFDRTMFTPTFDDGCSPPVTWRFVAVTSSEEGLSPCGSGNQDPDVFVAPDGSSFCVRVERCGNDPADNDGRRYLVEAVATDACGNTSLPQPMGFVLVPHDNADTSSCIYPVPIPLP